MTDNQPTPLDRDNQQTMNIVSALMIVGLIVGVFVIGFAWLFAYQASKDTSESLDQCFDSAMARGDLVGADLCIQIAENGQ